MTNMRRRAIMEVLLRQDPSEIAQLLAQLRAERQLDDLLHCLLAIVDKAENGSDGDHQQFRISQPVLDTCGDHFQTASPLAAHEQAKQLLRLLCAQRSGQAKRNLTLLFCTLIERVPMLSANRLRDFVKTELVECCAHFWSTGEPDLAAHLSHCVLQTLLMELAYIRGVSTQKSQPEVGNDAQRVWAELIANVENFELCPFLQLSTLLLLNAIVELGGTIDGNAERDEVARKCARKIGRRVAKEKLLEICMAKVDGGSGEDVNKMGVECTYNSALFHLLSRNLVIFCQLCTSKLHFPMVNFLVTYAQRHSTLDSLLHSLAKQPEIRHGQIGDAIEAALAEALPEEYRPKGNIRWAKLSENEAAFVEEERRKRKRRRQQQKSADENGQQFKTWESLLSIFENSSNLDSDELEEKLLRALSCFTNAKLEKLIAQAPFQTLANSPQSAQSTLRLLHFIGTQRKSVALPLRAELVDLMVAEPEPRTFSLQLGAKLMEIYADRLDSQPELPDLCTLCLSMFTPLEHYRHPNIEERARRQFLMAELAFLHSLLANMPKLLSSLAPAIVQLLPDFFVQNFRYRVELRDLLHPTDPFPDRLDHSLASLCRLIANRRKHFHKLLPFAIAGALTGEREMRFPHYQLLSALDDNDWALLASNLPTTEKRKFATLRAQFYKSNKIIG